MATDISAAYTVAAGNQDREHRLMQFKTFHHPANHNPLIRNENIAQYRVYTHGRHAKNIGAAVLSTQLLQCVVGVWKSCVHITSKWVKYACCVYT